MKEGVGRKALKKGRKAKDNARQDGPRKGAPLPKVKGNHTTKDKKGKGYNNLRQVPIKEKHVAKGEEY